MKNLSKRMAAIVLSLSVVLGSAPNSYAFLDLDMEDPFQYADMMLIVPGLWDTCNQLGTGSEFGFGSGWGFRSDTNYQGLLVMMPAMGIDPNALGMIMSTGDPEGFCNSIGGMGGFDVDAFRWKLEEAVRTAANAEEKIAKLEQAIQAAARDPRLKEAVRQVYMATWRSINQTYVEIGGKIMVGYSGAQISRMYGLGSALGFGTIELTLAFGVAGLAVLMQMFVISPAAVDCANWAGDDPNMQQVCFGMFTPAM